MEVTRVEWNSLEWSESFINEFVYQLMLRILCTYLISRRHAFPNLKSTMMSPSSLINVYIKI